MLGYEFVFLISFIFYVIILSVFFIKKLWIWKIIFYSLFYFYIIAIFAVTLFPIPIAWLDEIAKYGGQNNNFILFHSIFKILFDEHLYYLIKIKQILWNIILFVPLGFFLGILWEKNNLKKVVFISFLFAIFIECIQGSIGLVLWFQYRSMDIDDVFLNILWWMFGFCLYKINKKIYSK